MKNILNRIKICLTLSVKHVLIKDMLKTSVSYTKDLSKIRKSKINIHRANGIIEGWYIQNNTSRCALLLPPHPSFGGTIANNILKTINDVFVDIGFNTLRINFRGVGLSHGDVNNRSFDLQDTLEALDWFIAEHPDPEVVYVGGFGYGASVAIHAGMRKPGLNGFVAVSPQIEQNLDFNSLTPCPGGLVITAGNDTSTDNKFVEEVISNLFRRKGATIVTKEIVEADHIYKNCLPKLYGLILEYMNQNFESVPTDPKVRHEFG